MVGTVYMINHEIGWIAILTENNDFTIAEVLETTLPNINDVVSGDLESLGVGKLTIENKEEFEIFIQDIHSDRREAIKQLRITNHNKHQWEML